MYFNGNPVTVTAIPEPGFVFDHWLSTVAFPVQDTSRSATRNFSASDTITAFFTGSAIAPQLTVSEINYNSDSASNAGDWFELHNLTGVELDLSGWKVRDDNDQHEFIFPVTTVISANGYLVIAGDLQKFLSQHPGIENVTGEMNFNLGDGGDQIRLLKPDGSLFLSLAYSDQEPWDTTTDGDGYTLELLSASGDLSDGANWFAGCLGGSPGTAFAAPDAAVTVTGSSVICSGDTLILSAIQVSGNSYQWYFDHAAISGATGASFNPVQSGNYAVAVTNNGCSTTSDSIAVSVIPRSQNPVTVSVSRCGPGTLTLTASAADSIFWYDSMHNLLSSGNSFTTPSLAQTTIFFAQAGSTCASSLIPDTAVIHPVPSDPVVSNQSICGHGSITLSASSNSSISWYDAPGGNLLATGSIWVTPDLSQTTTYYAQSGTICKSSLVPLTVAVNPVSPDPAANDVSRCDEGSLTLFGAAGDSLRWYDAPDGNLLGTGAVFQTPVLGNTTTYYLRSGNVCPSNYVPVQAIISSVTPVPLIADQMHCGSGSVTFTAVATDTVRWYDSPGGNLVNTGISFTTPVLSASTAYYARAGSACASDEVEVLAIINTVAGDPVTASATRCGEGSVLLTAVAAEPISWYDAPNGTLLHSGNDFTTPAISQSTIFYARAGTVCPGNFIPAEAILHTVSPDPVCADQSQCGIGSFTFNATAADTVHWYDSPGGSILSLSATFTTAVLTETTTFYMRAEGICPGGFIPVVAAILPVPPDPIVTDVSRCGSGSLVLSAQSQEMVRWYDSPNGNLLVTGNSFTTPVLASTTPYYLRAEGTCNGNFIPVNAVILPVPADPVASDQSRCGSGPVSLTASGPDTIRWYDAAGLSLLAEGTAFSTPLLFETTTFSVRAENICRSAIVTVQAIVNALPADPVVTPGHSCGEGTVLLSASSPDPVSWFEAPHGILLGSGTTFMTPVLDSTDVFYVMAFNGCEGNFVPVNANVFAIPHVSLGNDTIIESGSGVILDAGTGFVSYLWNNGETSQTTSATSTGNYWVTVMDSNGCSTTDTVQVLVTVNVQPYILTDGFLIYPNPAQSTLSVSFMNGENEDIFLRLIENNGKLVWSDFSVNEKHVMRKIDIHHFARGLYVLQIATSKIKREFKVILN